MCYLSAVMCFVILLAQTEQKRVGSFHPSFNSCCIRCVTYTALTPALSFPSSVLMRSAFLSNHGIKAVMPLFLLTHAHMHI